MRTARLIILLIILTTRLYSQAADIDSLRIAYAQFDTIDKVQLIPVDALNGNFDLLIIGFEYDSVKIIDKKAIEISWTSSNIDGSYDLVITPKQIYLRSSHENPNPNYLYWMSDINRQQFDLIKEYLNAQNTIILEDCIIDESYRKSYFFTKFKKEKYLKNDWNNMLYDNFVQLLELINRPLKSGGNYISIPGHDDFNIIRPLRLIFGLDELDSQIEMIKLK